MGQDAMPSQPQGNTYTPPQPTVYQGQYAPQPAAAAYPGYAAQGVPQQPITGQPAVHYAQIQAPAVQVTHVINGMPITPGPGQSIMVEEEMYCGPITWLIGIFLLPCICFCPVDRRQRIITTTQNTTTVHYTA